MGLNWVPLKAPASFSLVSHSHMLISLVAAIHCRGCLHPHKVMWVHKTPVSTLEVLISKRFLDISSGVLLFPGNSTQTIMELIIPFQCPSQIPPSRKPAGQLESPRLTRSSVTSFSQRPLTSILPCPLSTLPSRLEQNLIPSN